MRRNILVVVTAIVAMAGLANAQEDPGDPHRNRPNFLVILCDDLGYGDLGCFGHPRIQTPHLDRLAEQGARLTACYSAAPVCSSSRAGLLTGRTPSRVGVYDWIPGGHVMHVPRAEITIADVLADAGYATCHVGKWHCNGRFNDARQPQPGDHGFQHWFATQNNASPSHRDPKNFVRNGRKVGPQEGFSCQLVADEAIAWLERLPRDQAFFQWVCFHEPHEPIDSPSEWVDQYPRAKARGEALYYANVSNMDAAVGRLLEALKATGREENTFVVFTSDNGPETLNRYRGAWRSHGSPGPLRGMKLHLHEAGIRVPGLMRMPGLIQPGTIVDEPVCSLDFLPTFAAMAGAAAPADRPLDGADFRPALAGRTVPRSTPLYWHYFRSIGRPKAAMRIGKFVILGHWDQDRLGPGGSLHAGDMATIQRGELTEFELYDLDADLEQEVNLIAKRPQLARKYSELLRQKYREVRDAGPEWLVE